MYLFFVFFFVFSAIVGFGGIEDHFVRNFEKNCSHKLRKIDFIYLINLDKRPEKLQSCLKQLEPYKIFPCRFPAVNGWELPLETINDLGLIYESWMRKKVKGTFYFVSEGKVQHEHEVIQHVGKTYFSHCMPRGSIGCIMSHLSVLQDAYDSGYETIWVMEDDIDVKVNPNEISHMIDKLDSKLGKKGWDIFFTDPDTKNNDGNYVPCIAFAKRPNFFITNTKRIYNKKSLCPEIKYVPARYGSYSMIIRRSGIEKILSFFKTYRLFLPYDIDLFQPDNLRCFGAKKDIVSTQIRAPSDNGEANYQKYHGEI